MPIPAITTKASPVNPGPMVEIDLLKSMLNHALQLVTRAKDNPNVNHQRQWFGQGAGGDAEVTAWTDKLHGYLNGGLKTINFSCCATVDSIASFAQYQADKVRGGKAMLPGVRNMQLNAGFSSDRYSYGEKVGSLLHEITHMCLGTNDEKIMERECYGAPLCGTLARVRPELAITNADNWGYYFTSYHSDLNLTGTDWAYLTEAEVEARSSGVKGTIDKGVSVQMVGSKY